MADLVARSDQFIEAYNAKNFDAMSEMIVADLDFAHYNRNFTFRRRDDLLVILKTFSEEYVPDRHFMPPERVLQIGRLVIREAWYTGTPRVDLPGFGLAGQQFWLKFVSFMTFDDSCRVVEWKDYG